MEGYRNILCATDFSESSEAAILRAADLAKRYGAELMLLHVAERFPVDRSCEYIPPEDIDPAEYRLQCARRRLSEQAERTGAGDAGQEVIVSNRSAKYEIVELAASKGVDLLVLATHGEQGVAPILGSTASGVLHRASCDVLAVRAG